MSSPPPPAPPAPPAPIDDVILRVADGIGGLMEFWGFKRNMGRLWTLLYLEPRPLSAADIGDRLTLSAGAVSMLLADMQQWGAVKKSWVPGDRRDYYEAETSIWKMISRVFRERELRQIQGVSEIFDTALGALAAQHAARSDEDARLTLAQARLTELSTLARVGAHLLETMLSGASVDVLPIKNLGELMTAAAATTGKKD